MQPVMRVENAIAYVFTYSGDDGRKLYLSAQGSVNTSGWNDPELKERVYRINPPADGILEFDFNAQPPAGPSSDVISPIATWVETQVPMWFKGVRIYGQHNKLEPEVVPGEPT